MVTISEKTLDIEKILRSKMGDKAKRVPRFVVKWLEHISHQDEINQFIWKARDLTGSDWLEAVLKELNCKVEVEGLENLPSKDDPRRDRFVSNQPLGGIDGAAIGSVIGKD